MASDAFLVIAERLAALRKVTGAMLPHARALAAAGEFEDFLRSIDRCVRKYEAFLEADLRETERLEANAPRIATLGDAENEALRRRLIAAQPEGNA